MCMFHHSFLVHTKPFINFVGHFETLAVDARRLLQSLPHDAWTRFGATGWPPHGGAMFADTSAVKHATHAARVAQEYYFNNNNGNAAAIQKAVAPLVEREYQMKIFQSNGMNKG